MKKEAFLFDLDGVLVDTAVFHFAAWRKLTQELGFDIDEEFNETLKGISRMDSLNRILDHGNVQLNEQEKADLATKKNVWYLDLVEQMTEKDILPGVEEFLIKSKNAGIKIALGSASKNAGIILEKTNLQKYFDATVDGNAVSKSKPDPEVFIKGAEALGVPNEACVVFEDAYAGIQAAKSAGMYAVGIGLASALSNADKVISTFENLELTDI